MNTMSDVVVRDAREEDCRRIMELVMELARYERAPEQVTVCFEDFVQSGFGPQPVWWGLVAEHNSRIVAFALWYVRYSTWKGRRMYLEDIYVEPGMRGRGVGKMLLDRLAEQARARGFSGMMWQVLDWNEPAIRFYRNYGASMDGQWINCSLDFQSSI